MVNMGWMCQIRVIENYPHHHHHQYFSFEGLKLGMVGRKLIGYVWHSWGHTLICILPYTSTRVEIACGFDLESYISRRVRL